MSQLFLWIKGSIWFVFKHVFESSTYTRAVLSKTTKTSTKLFANQFPSRITRPISAFYLIFCPEPESHALKQKVPITFIIIVVVQEVILLSLIIEKLPADLQHLIFLKQQQRWQSLHTDSTKTNLGLNLKSCDITKASFDLSSCQAWIQKWLGQMRQGYPFYAKWKNECYKKCGVLWWKLVSEKSRV